MKMLVIVLVFTIIASIVDSRELYGVNLRKGNGLGKLDPDIPHYEDSEDYYADVTEPKPQEEGQNENVLTSKESDSFAEVTGKPDIDDHTRSLFSDIDYHTMFSDYIEYMKRME
uniref:Uncharacterized protein MJECL44 n=1 Tax=Zeugodacus cucurbitae TaxID=28588 RepID=A0A0A1WUX3_ZEUCU